MKTENKVVLFIFLAISIMATIGGYKKLDRPGMDHGYVATHHHELAIKRDLGMAGASFKTAIVLLLASTVVIGSEMRRKRITIV